MKSNTTTWQTLRIYSRYTWRYPVDFIIGSVGAVLAVITQTMIPTRGIKCIQRFLKKLSEFEIC